VHNAVATKHFGKNYTKYFEKYCNLQDKKIKDKYRNLRAHYDHCGYLTSTRDSSTSVTDHHGYHYISFFLINISTWTISLLHYLSLCMQNNMAFIKVKILSSFESRKGGSLFVADAIDTNNRIIWVYLHKSWAEGQNVSTWLFCNDQLQNNNQQWWNKTNAQQRQQGMIICTVSFNSALFWTLKTSTYNDSAMCLLT
jgi:hypothetical protein